jgi:SAM-dependent methyltransferase
VAVASLPDTTRPLREVDGGVLSALAPGDEGAPYDRHAEVYDRLIGNRFYNRLLWGCDPAEYAAFAAEALATGEGPFLDVGCGTAVFTADVYRRGGRPVVLVDRSTGMLRKARERLGEVPLAYVQADLFDLPFAAGTFATVGCFGVLHVLDDPWRALAGLRGVLVPGGRAFVSMLVVARAVSRGYHRLLRRAGEMGPPHRLDDLARSAHDLFDDVAVTRSGAMAWLRAAVR